MKLAGKVVVITGAAAGLGKALAKAATDRKAQIIAVDNDARGLSVIQNELPGIITVQADMGKPGQVERAWNDSLQVGGQIDVWINNAGILGVDGDAVNVPIESIQDVFYVNTIGLIRASQLAAEYFRHNGMLVNILSTAALGIRPGRSIYSASKHASHAFTQALKQEHPSLPLLAVYPDGIKTELFGDDQPEDYEEFMEVDYVARRIISAIEKAQTKDLVIRR